MHEVESAPGFRASCGRSPIVEASALEATAVAPATAADDADNGASPSGRGRNVPEGPMCGAVPRRWCDDAPPPPLPDATGEGPTGGTGGSRVDCARGFNSVVSASRSWIEGKAELCPFTSPDGAQRLPGTRNPGSALIPLPLPFNPVVATPPRRSWDAASSPEATLKGENDSSKGGGGSQTVQAACRVVGF